MGLPEYENFNFCDRSLGGKERCNSVPPAVPPLQEKALARSSRCRSRNSRAVFCTPERGGHSRPWMYVYFAHAVSLSEVRWLQQADFLTELRECPPTSSGVGPHTLNACCGETVPLVAKSVLFVLVIYNNKALRYPTTTIFYHATKDGDPLQPTGCESGSTLRKQAFTVFLMVRSVHFIFSSGHF